MLSQSQQSTIKTLNLSDSNNSNHIATSNAYHNRTQTSIIYLYNQPSSRLFSNSLQLFNLYKKFVQNTIIELGQDWRIESGLLAQEIINQKSLNNQDFCIFNQFMTGFLRTKIQSQPINNNPDHSIHQSSTIQQNKIKTEQQQQYEFLKYFCRTFPKTKINQTQIMTQNRCFSNNKITIQDNQQNEFSNNLTFKTLSLGFYITAQDIWIKMFKHFYKKEVQDCIQRININQKTNIEHPNSNIQYFATLSHQKPTQSLISDANPSWIVQSQSEIHSMIHPYFMQLMNFKNKNKSQNLTKAIKLGSVVVNITETIIKIDKNNGNEEKRDLIVRRIDLCEQFYREMFLVWLIFSIKKSFNSNMFPCTCYMRYCDIIIGSRIFGENESRFEVFHLIYGQFKILCDNEWKKLMKDYMVALNDDREVLGVLVKRIDEQLMARYVKQIGGKKSEIIRMSGL